MPIGNGDFAANIWFSEGKLHLLLSKSDAWSEEGRLLKVGQVSLKFNPNFFNNEFFRQKLSVKDATVSITGSHGASVEIWIDALMNVLNVEMKSPHHAVALESSLFVWRDRVRNFMPGEETSFMGATCNRSRVFHPDIVLPADEQGNLVWYHRNENRSIFSDQLLREGLDPSFVAGLSDPLLNRTFGALLRARSVPAPAAEPAPFHSPSPRRLVSRGAAPHHAVQVVAHTDVTATAAAWRAGLAARAEEAEAAGREAAREAHAGWWAALWRRSHIDLAADGDGGGAAAASRGHCLERYVQACAGRGEQPIKFNGNLFTVEARGFDPDFRQASAPPTTEASSLPTTTRRASPPPSPPLQASASPGRPSVCRRVGVPARRSASQVPSVFSSPGAPGGQRKSRAPLASPCGAGGAHGGRAFVRGRARDGLAGCGGGVAGGGEPGPASRLGGRRPLRRVRRAAAFASC